MNAEHSKDWAMLDRPRRAGRERILAAVCGAVTIVALLASWELAAAWGARFTMIIPPPSHFLRELGDSHFKVGLGSQASTIPASVVSSLLRVLVGLLLGFVCALAAGAVLSMSRAARLFLLPVVRLMAPIAPVAWIPLGLVLLGIGNQTAVFIVFMGVFFTLTLATLQAIDYVPAARIENARCLGCTRWQMWNSVMLPSILPNVFTAVRLNFVAAWMAVLAAEMTGLQDGLGAIIMIGRNLFDNNLILLGMCLIGGAGFCGDVLLKTLQIRLLWWGDK